MIKLNQKYLSKCKTEPFEHQVLDNGLNIDIYYMNEEPFYSEFVNRGKFFFWACDGKDQCKIFIDKGYYDALSVLFTKDVNQAWSDYYDTANKAQVKVRNRIFVPILIGYLVFFIGFMILCRYVSVPSQVQLGVYLFLLILVMVGSSKINKWVRNQIDLAQEEAIANIKRIVGPKEYKRLLHVQDKYKNKFFGTQETTDPEVEEDLQEEEQTKISPELVQLSSQEEIEEDHTEI